jgi:hypothetical protein
MARCGDVRRHRLRFDPETGDADALPEVAA